MLLGESRLFSFEILLLRIYLFVLTHIMILIMEEVLIFFFFFYWYKWENMLKCSKWVKSFIENDDV